MKYPFFHIPAVDPATETEALNRFLGQQRILSGERQLVADGQARFWALAVLYAYIESTQARVGSAVRTFPVAM